MYDEINIPLEPEQSPFPQYDQLAAEYLRRLAAEDMRHWRTHIRRTQSEDQNHLLRTGRPARSVS